MIIIAKCEPDIQCTDQDYEKEVGEEAGRRGDG